MIRDIRFTPASGDDLMRGLVAYVRVRYGTLLIDGITLRMTRAGEPTLGWPARRDRQGRDHPLVRPFNDEARRELEQAVFAELRRQEGAA